jgi:hypothetical protein
MYELRGDLYRTGQHTVLGVVTRAGLRRLHLDSRSADLCRHLSGPNRLPGGAECRSDRDRYANPYAVADRAEPHPNPDSYRDRHPDAHGLRDAESVGDAVQHADRFEYAYGDIDSDDDTDAEQNGHGNSDRNGVQHRDCEQHAVGDCHAHRYLTGNSYQHRDRLPDAHANTHRDANRRLRSG